MAESQSLVSKFFSHPSWTGIGGILTVAGFIVAILAFRSGGIPVEKDGSAWFASELKSLRLHLLTKSPAPFRRRNLFVDSTLGDRV